mgnify:CR=1 FL=1
MKAIDFLKPNINFLALAELIEMWEQWRCADGAENVYDLVNENDFKLFIDKYGVDVTIKFYNQNRFYLDGMNFNAPVTLTNQYMINMVNDVYDDEHFVDLYVLGWLDVDCNYGKYFNVEKLVKYLKDKSLVA